MKPYIFFGILILVSAVSGSSNQMNSWGYQLQNYDLDALRSFDVDILVIDYSKDGTDSTAFTKQEITDLQSNGKRVVSYISIGEAEDYRYYFDESWLSSPPVWMDGENPDWEGNYKVKYWDPEWQTIIFSYLDKIISAGFDGVYLDIIDAYEFYEDSVPEAPQLMIEFVSNISNYTRQKAGSDFLIIPQNGEGLLQNDEYREVIDAIGKEDLYLEEDGITHKTDEREYSENLLDLLIGDNKPVLLVEYTSDPNAISYVQEQAQIKGYTLYIGVRALDRLVSQNFSTTESNVPFLLLPSIATLTVLRRRADSSPR